MASSRPPSTQATVRRATGSYARQIQSLQVFFEKMPHLIERDNDGLSRHGRFGQPAGFVANPLENRDIADPEKASDAAKAHIAHGIIPVLADQNPYAQS